MLSRKVIAYLTDFIMRYLPPPLHFNLDHLIEKIDLDPSVVAPGLGSSRGIEARIKSLFFNVRKDLNKVVEFLNVFLEKYGYRIGKDEIESIKPLLESCGVTIIADEKGYAAKLIVPVQTAEEPEGSLLSTLLPESVLQRLEEAIEQYGSGRFDFVVAKCRTSLEALANENGYGTNFKKMIRELRDQNKIREREEELLIKLYDYLSSFEATHAAPIPNKHQALYALNLTRYTLLFLAHILQNNR